MNNPPQQPSPREIAFSCSFMLVFSALFMWGVKALFCLTDYGKSRTVEDQWLFALLIFMLVIITPCMIIGIINYLKQVYGKQKLRQVLKALVLQVLFLFIVLVIPGILLLSIFSTPFPLMWVLGSVMYGVIVIKVLQSGILNFPGPDK